MSDLLHRIATLKFVHRWWYALVVTCRIIKRFDSRKSVDLLELNKSDKYEDTHPLSEKILCTKTPTINKTYVDGDVPCLSH